MVALGQIFPEPISLADVRLDVVPLPPRSSSLTVAGSLLGGYPAGRDLWGGDHVVGRVLLRINIGTNVWGESSIMTGVYECWWLSTLHIRWGLCDSLCLVLVCRGRYGLELENRNLKELENRNLKELDPELETQNLNPELSETGT